MTEWIKNWFSNMLPCDHPIKDELGVEYATVENFYQAQKFPDLETRKLIASLTPYAAKKKAREIRLSPEAWKAFETRKLEVMAQGLSQKFAPGTTWCSRLLASEGDIVEWNNWNDRWWGKTTDGIGENHLGKLLTELREELREIEI